MLSIPIFLNELKLYLSDSYSLLHRYKVIDGSEKERKNPNETNKQFLKTRKEEGIQ